MAPYELPHNLIVSNILVSALVAIVTTLVIEYLAKPGLEARKERILEEARGRRLVLSRLRLTAFLFRKLHESLHQDSPMQAFEDPEVIMRRIRATIDATVEVAMGGDFGLTESERISLHAYIAVLEFWRDEPMDFEQNSDMVLDCLELAMKALGTPGWRVVANYRIRQEAMKMATFADIELPRFSS